MNILITGLPGVGKTTLIKRVAEKLGGFRIGGFYTEEIREEGKRVGFRIVTFNGGEGLLSHVKVKSPFRVGRYGVDIEAFEEVALPSLQASSYDLIIVDEIGKMELFSEKFKAAVIELLSSPTHLLATVGKIRDSFVKEITARKDVTLVEVTVSNRDNLAKDVLNLIYQVK